MEIGDEGRGVAPYAEIRDLAMVGKIEVDNSDLAAGVHYHREGRWQFQRARNVVVAGYAIETPRLLLNSADGVRAWVDGTPVEARREIGLDLKTGTHTLTFGLDLGRRREPLRVEVAEVKGSPAQVRVVGGK